MFVVLVSVDSNTTKYVVLAFRSMPAVVPVAVPLLEDSVSEPRLPPGWLFDPDDSMRRLVLALSMTFPIGNVTLVSL